MGKIKVSDDIRKVADSYKAARNASPSVDTSPVYQFSSEVQSFADNVSSGKLRGDQLTAQQKKLSEQASSLAQWAKKNENSLGGVYSVASRVLGGWQDLSGSINRTLNAPLPNYGWNREPSEMIAAAQTGTIGETPDVMALRDAATRLRTGGGDAAFKSVEDYYKIKNTPLDVTVNRADDFKWLKEYKEKIKGYAIANNKRGISADLITDMDGVKNVSAEISRTGTIDKDAYNKYLSLMQKYHLDEDTILKSDFSKEASEYAQQATQSKVYNTNKEMTAAARSDKDFEKLSALGLKLMKDGGALGDYNDRMSVGNNYDTQLKYMTDEQKAIYAYYLAKGGAWQPDGNGNLSYEERRKEADRYYHSIAEDIAYSAAQDAVNARHQPGAIDWDTIANSGNPVGMLMNSARTTNMAITQLRGLRDGNENAAAQALEAAEKVDYLGDLFNTSVGNAFQNIGAGLATMFGEKNDEDYYSPTPSDLDIQRGLVYEKYAGDNKVRKVVADLVMNTGNMAPQILATTVASLATGGMAAAGGAAALAANGINAAASVATMGMQVYGESYDEGRRMGMDTDQASVYGLLNAGSELALGEIMGKAGRAGGTVLSRGLQRIAPNIDNAVTAVAAKVGKTAWGKYLANVVGEGAEEYMQDVLEPWFKAFATGEEFGKLNFRSADALYSGLIGMLSAGLMDINGVVNIGQEITLYKDAGAQIKRAGTVGQLKSIASTFSADTKAYQLAEKLTENSKPTEIGKALKAVGATLSDQNVASMSAYLQGKYKLPKDSADKLIGFFRDYCSGVELSDEGLELLDVNDEITEAFLAEIVGKNVSGARKNAALQALAQNTNFAEDMNRPEQEFNRRNTAFLRFMADTMSGKSSTDTQNAVAEETSAAKKSAEAPASVQQKAAPKETRTVDASKTSVENVREWLNNSQIVDKRAVDTLVDSYESAGGNQDVLTFVRDAELAYTYGKYNMNESVETAGSPLALTEEQAQQARSLGKMFGWKASMEKQAAVSKESDNAQPNRGTVRFEYDAQNTRLTAREQTSVDVLSALAQAYGLKLSFFESTMEDGKRVYKTQDGKTVSAPNGYYTSSDGTIHIDVHAGQVGQGVVMYTAAHELTHYIAAWDAGKFRELANFLVEQYGKAGQSVSSYVARQMEKAERQGRTLSYDEAFEEFVADSMETMLADGRVAEKLRALKEKDKTLWQKVKDFFKDFTANLKKLAEQYKDAAPDSEEGKFVASLNRDVIEKLEDLFTEGVAEASENSGKVGSAEGAETAESKESVRFSERDNEQRDLLKGQTQKEITSRFQTEVDQILNMQDTTPRQLIVGYTPDLYQKLGMPSLPLTIGSGHVYSAVKTEAEAKQDGNFHRNVHYHGLGEAAVKNIYEAIQDPVMVISSKDVDKTAVPLRSTHSVVAIIDIGTAQKSLLVPVEITAERTVNGSKMDVNTISSVYDRPVDGLIRDAIALENSGDIGVFYAKKEATALVSAGVQFPVQMQQSMASDGIVHQLSEKVNMKISDVVQSQQFKRWFGDWQNDPQNASKVVNADGTPKVVYHQTNADFTIFDTKHEGAGTRDSDTPFGIFMKSSNKNIGLNGNKQMALYADIKKPLTVENREQLINELQKLSSEYAQALAEHQRLDAEYKQKSDDAIKELRDYMVQWRKENPDASKTALYDDSKFNRLFDAEDNITDEWESKGREIELRSKKAITKDLEAAGYDGIIIHQDKGSFGRSTDAYIALHPEQVKSATDNIGTFDRSNPDIRFSDRDPNLPVTRAELAGKLMELTNNPIEVERLTDYIDNAKNLDELQTKLQKLNNELKKLPAEDKATDRVTKEKIAALRLEAQKTANRLDTYERKLVNLEATAPIKALMQRQSDMAYRRGTQMAERLRGRYTYDRMLDIIKRVGKKLDASKNTERTKEGVRTLAETVVSQSLQFFDKDTGMDAQTMLMGIANMYAELKDSMDTYIEDAYKPEVHLALTELAADLAGRTRQDLTTNELQEMYNVLRAVETSINKAGYLFGKESSTTVRQAAEAVVTEMQAQKQAKPRLAATKRITDFVSKAAWADMKPIYAIRTINSPQLTKMFNELLYDGQNTWIRDVNRGAEFMQEAAKKYNFEKWDHKARHEYTDKEGQKISLSLEQMMYLYALIRRGEQAINHLYQGGFVFAEDVTTDASGKRIAKDPKAHQLTTETMEQIRNKLKTDYPEAARFVEDVQEYLSTVLAKDGNEVSYELYGLNAYGEKNYIPIHSAGDFHARANEVQFQKELGFAQGLANRSFTKRTVRKASNPILLSNFSDVASGHISDMAQYHAFAVPLTNLKKVMAWSERAPDVGGAPESVRSAIRARFGSDAPVKYLDNLVNDLNASPRRDPTETILDKGLSVFKRSAVVASASVAIQQPSAIARTLYVMNPLNFLGAKVEKTKLGKTWDQLCAYSSTAAIKDMGGFDVGMSGSTADYIFSGAQTKGEKVKAGIDAATGFAPEYMDKVTWCTIWNAVKRETKRSNPGLLSSSEEFLKKAGRRFDEIVNLTQVYDSTLTKSQAMRSKSTHMKMITAFMAEPTTSINMLVDGFRQGGKTAVKAVATWTAAALLNSLLASIIYAGRDDDDEKTWVEKYAASFADEMKDSMNPLTAIPLVQDLWNICQGWDVERSDMSVFADIVNGVRRVAQRVSSGKEIGWKDYEETILAAVQALGLPLKNISRDLRAVVQTITSQPLSDTQWYEILSGALPSLFPADKSAKLYYAITNGNTEYAERLRGTYKDDVAYHTGIRTALSDTDPRIVQAAQALDSGDLEEYKRLVNAIKSMGFIQDDVVSAVNNKYNEMHKDDSEREFTEGKISMYKSEHYVASVVGGLGMEDEIFNEIVRAYLVKNADKGYSKEDAEGNVRKSLLKELKEAYVDTGVLDRTKAKTALQKWMSADKAEETLKQWDYSKSGSGEWDDRYDTYYDAILNGGDVKKLKDQILKAGIKEDTLEDSVKKRIKQDVSDGTVSRAAAKQLLTRYAGVEEEDVETTLNAWDYMDRHPDTELDVKEISQFYTKYKGTGLPEANFEQYLIKKQACKGVDKDGDGRAENGTKKAQVMAVIDALPVSNEVKDALYFAEDYKASTLYEAPWR